LHYAGVVTHSAREAINQTIPLLEEFDDIDDVNNAVFEDIFDSEPKRNYLFPGNKMLIDYVPYESSRENIPLLYGKHSQFYSSLQSTAHDVSGLFSAGSSFVCSRPPESYTIDVFGHNDSDLEHHVLFHLRKALERTKGEFCLQIFVEKGYIAEELCKLLIKLGIKKCNWYIEGGVSVKSIVKEILN